MKILRPTVSTKSLIGLLLVALLAGCSTAKLAEGTYVGKAMRLDASKKVITFYVGDDPGVISILKDSKFKFTASHGDGTELAEGRYKVDGSYVKFYLEKVWGKPVREEDQVLFTCYFSEKGKLIDLEDERYKLYESSDRK